MRRVAAAAGCGALALAILAGVPRCLPASEPWGQTVVGTRLKCDADLRLEDFRDAITQKVNQPLDPALVAQSLKNLFATGRFTNLRVEAEPAAGGVELVFVGKAQYFVGIVRAEGTPSALEARALVTASRLRLGQALSESGLAEASHRIVEFLASNAYYRARVEQQVEQDTKTQEANVVFSVTPGPPARLSGVEFQGTTVFPAARLASEAGWHDGLHLTAVRLERGIFKLHQFYVKHDRLQALARIDERRYDPKLNTEKLRVQVDAGPAIVLNVEGARLPPSKLKQLLPVYRDGVVDDPALTRSAAILEDYFQQQGYFSAAVKGERITKGQTVRVSFRVTLGVRGEFVGYSVKGNRNISTPELMAAISPPVQGLFPLAPVFSRDLLQRKIDGLKSLYESRGYLVAQVTPNIDKQYKAQPGHWFVTFQIAEGERTTVRNLLLSGVDAQAEKRLSSALLTSPSRVFSPERALTDRDYITSYFADRGYAHATVTWHATPVPDRPQVDVEFRIDPGAQERIRKVLLVGNQHTRPGVIRDELAMRAGEPLRQSEVLESQRRLYDLGVFNQVQIATQEQSDQVVDKTVLVGVEEARRWTLGYGGGLEVQRLSSATPSGQYQASPRLSLDLSRLDVTGRAQTFSLRGRLSNLDTGGSVGYYIPRLLAKSDLHLRLNGLVDRSRDVLTFTADRREASASVEKVFSPKTLFVVRLSFRRVQALDISNRISVVDIPLLSRPARVGMFGVTYINDQRDDPADATHGSYSVADAGIATGALGSQADFLRFTGQNATYYRLGAHLIFARNTRIGIESPYGPPDKTTIPLPERFFMGGSESHRGFAINQAGPRDPNTGFPIGGNALFFNSLELRVPMAERRFGLVFFHDAGNVYSTVRKMRLLKFTQNSPGDLDYTVHAVGTGIRYKTPVGPLRFDVGFNLNPPRYPVVTRQNGVNVTEVQRLSTEQFFISVGQSF